MTPNNDISPPLTSTSPPPARFRLILRALQVRLRFVIVLAVAFLVVGKWDAVRNQADWFRRWMGGTASASPSVSSDTEFFCPMDPGVLSDWPGKCGICNMGLVRRKKGEALALPSGVVARMQISPYRIQLAGVQTSLVGYQPLVQETVLVGVVQASVIVAEASSRELAWLSEGQTAAVSSESRPGKTFDANIASLHDASVTLAYQDPDHVLQPGSRVIVRIRRPVSEIEPFRTMPSEPPPLRKGEPRTIHLCRTHPEILQIASGTCPVDRAETLRSDRLRSNQRITWWCPTHPKRIADHDGETCEACLGMRLIPRVITYRPPGEVLTVPESAVVDTGMKTVVYVETMPGMFDGVEIAVGPRCGENYPVISGIEADMRIAAAGTFLIDAETRLNPALAASYFGAGPKAASNSEAMASVGDLDPLSALQKICPVTRKRLGSMGTPLKVTVKGRAVMVCCEGCEPLLLKSPEKYLARLDASKSSAARP